MSIAIDRIQKAYDLLKAYNGANPYIVKLKNSVFAYKDKQLTDFECNYVIENHDFEPIRVNKIVKVADWWGEKMKEEWGIEFVPKKVKITWLLGRMDGLYHFFCIYRKSQEKAVEVFATDRAILTDFTAEDYTLKNIDFRPYNEKSGRKLFPHQEEAVKFLTTRKKAILADTMGLGKLEPVSSLIPTPNGYKKMGDIKVGDKVFGSDGMEHNVIETFPHKDKAIYKVTFTDNSYCRCGLEHLWIVRTPNDRRDNRGWKVKSLQEILETGLEWKNKLYHRYKFEIPITQPIQYNQKEHLIHPYILGVCIGDGNMCNGGIHISIPDSEIETSVKIKELLNEEYTLSENRSSSCPRYSIVGKRRIQMNVYNREIKRLGLNVHGNDKFIPDEYKIDSIENRISLLRGLMDSDGSITKRNKIYYSTNSQILANDVRELVTSLGGVARVHGYTREKGGKTRTEYTVMIQICINPFSLKRKSDKYNPTFKKYCVRKIKSVEYDGIEDAQCISVDSSDNSYITSKFHIVTHNTVSAIVAALEDRYEHVLIICPASLKVNWKNELSMYVDEDDITIVEGSKWKDNRFTIINYDILKNFYEVPTVMKKTKELNLTDDGEIVNVVKEKEVVSRSRSVIEKAMENSQLYQSRFDLIIIDEAHRLSNTSSGIYKIVSDLVERSRPKGIYELSGTLVTNRPINLYNMLKIIGHPLSKDWKYYVNRYCDGKTFFNKNEKKAYTAIFLKNRKKQSWYDLTDEERKELDEYLEQHCKKVWVTTGASHLDDLQEVIKTCYMRRDKKDLELVGKTVRTVEYDLTDSERKEYDNVWEQYLNEQAEREKAEKHKSITEGIVFRQWLADTMIPRTIGLVDKLTGEGKKVIVFCSFDNEIRQLKEHFGDSAVIHNGKQTAKKKDKAVDAFQNDPNVKVFIGNIISAGVGLTLIASSTVVFNSITFVPGDMLQAEDRIHRLNQTHDCTIYYQLFKNTYMEHMFDIVHEKNEIINQIIIRETEK